MPFAIRRFALATVCALAVVGARLDCALSADLAAPKDFHGTVVSTAGDIDDVLWLATFSRLYKVSSKSVELVDMSNDGQVRLAPRGGLYALLSTAASGRSEIILKRTVDTSVIVRITRKDAVFSDLVLGGSGDLILSTSHSPGNFSYQGPFDYGFWSASGNLLGRFVSDRPAKAIVDPLGASVLLLQDDAVRAFDANGNRLWEIAGTYRKAAISSGGHVTLLNPKDPLETNQVHVIRYGKRMIHELPSAVHDFELSPEGNRAVIAADEGSLYLLDVSSSAITEISLPMEERHFVTDVQFIDSTAIALAVVHAQDARITGERIVPTFSEVVLLELDGTIIHREGTPFSSDTPWAPALRVTAPGQITANGPSWIKMLEFSRMNRSPHSPTPRVNANPLERNRAALVWRRLQSSAMKKKLRSPSNLHGWPLEPQDQSHPLMGVLGEFNNYGGVYQHTGHDLAASPWSDSVQDPTWVAVTVPGDLKCEMHGGSTSNYCDVQGEDGLMYQYMHLVDTCSGMGSIVPACIYGNNGSRIDAGERLGFVVPFDQAFHHLHYQVSSDSELLDGFSRMRPKIADSSVPIVSDIVVAREGSAPSPRWTPLLTQGTWADGNTQCTLISGEFDIVAEISDFDDWAKALIGVYRVQFDVCPASELGCLDPQAGGSQSFSSMPMGWWAKNNAETKAQFSSEPNMISTTSFFSKKIYYVPTNWSANGPDSAGAWHSALLPNGDYRLTVRAVDFAGNEGFGYVNLCVDNP